MNLYFFKLKRFLGGSTRRGMSLSKSKVSVQEGTQDDMPQDQDQENSDVEDGEENYMQHNDEEYEEVDDNIRNDDDDDEEVDVPEGAYDEVEEEGGDSGREEEEEEEGENDEGLENSVQSIRNRYCITGIFYRYSIFALPMIRLK